MPALWRARAKSSCASDGSTPWISVGAQRAVNGGDHVLGRMEVGFAQLQMDNVAALALQLPRAQKDGERAFAAQFGDAFGQWLHIWRFAFLVSCFA